MNNVINCWKWQIGNQVLWELSLVLEQMFFFIWSFDAIYFNVLSKTGHLCNLGSSMALIVLSLCLCSFCPAKGIYKDFHYVLTMRICLGFIFLSRLKCHQRSFWLFPAMSYHQECTRWRRIQRYWTSKQCNDIPALHWNLFRSSFLFSLGEWQSDSELGGLSLLCFAYNYDINTFRIYREDT